MGLRVSGVVLALGMMTAGAAMAEVSAPVLERVVFLRHAEKPPQSLGQLTCQGLNRALALPPVLVGKYGRPDFIFAPDPKQERTDPHHSAYDYVRPLATIEPTAIQLGLPVNTQYNTARSDELRRHLGDARYQQSLIFVAWEHHLAEHMAKNMVAQWGGDASAVPAWADDDYDSLYVVDLRRAEGKTTVSFRREAEGLDGQDKLCPAQRQHHE